MMLGSAYISKMGVMTEHPLLRSMLEFESLLRSAQQDLFLEAVPEPMLELFDECQWPQLMLEFQPSLRLYSSQYDVVFLHQALSRGLEPDLPISGDKMHWIIFQVSDETRIRTASVEEMRAIELAKAAANLERLAASLAPVGTGSRVNESMNSLLRGWMHEELIIDIGVPVPEGAEYES